MFAYVAPLQMRRKGDLWPYSTRATEGRGARYKRIKRTTVCHRKPAAEVMKAVRNVKTGTHSFKKSAYNSRSSLQLLRGVVAQERSAHAGGGRSRIATTGRTTLVRSLPKWLEAETPDMGRLLDPAALEVLVGQAAAFFERSAALGMETDAVLPSAAKA
eukprot:5628295-Prymnesium_polylepis.1